MSLRPNCGMSSGEVPATTPLLELPDHRTVFQRLALALATLRSKLFAFPKGIQQLDDLAVWQSLLTSLPLVCADVLSIYISLFTAATCIEAVMGIDLWKLEGRMAFVISFASIPISRLAGLYPGLGLGPIFEFRQIARGLIASTCLLAGAGIAYFPRMWLPYCFYAFVTFAFALPMSTVFRAVVRRIAGFTTWWGVPVILVGNPSRCGEVRDVLCQNPEFGFRPRAIVPFGASRASSLQTAPEAANYGRGISEAEDTATRLRVAWAILCSSSEDDPSDPIESGFSIIPNRVVLSSTAFPIGLCDQMFCVGDYPGIRFASTSPETLRALFKRWFDVLFAGAALIVAMPVMIVIGIAILLTSPGSIFFSQERVGYRGIPFRAWKFRSMYHDSEERLGSYLTSNPAAGLEWSVHHKLKHDPRLTWVGRIIRAASLDELPQLWNVIRGDMSLVGPRPLIDSEQYDAEYIRKHSAEYDAYKSVRPGLTGLWQIRARNRAGYEMRMYWDMYYIKNWCLWLDLYVVVRTVRSVLLCEGV